LAFSSPLEAARRAHTRNNYAAYLADPLFDTIISPWLLALLIGNGFGNPIASDANILRVVAYLSDVGTRA
jgi:predicted Zn-dependent protease